MMDMTIASTITMNTTTKRHLKMIRFMHRCAVKRSSHAMSTYTATVEGPFIDTGIDHTPASSHAITAEIETAPPAHDHRHKTTARTALLLILGSSPMVEGIPAFFAAGKYGIGLIVVMGVVFAISTIATYMLLCVYSTAGLQRVRLGVFERYGEVLSGVFIALVGVAFWIWPVL